MAWTDFLRGIDWGGIAKQAVPAMIGAAVSGNANRNAAQQIVQSQQLAAQQQAAANERAAQIIANANQQSAQQITNANTTAGQLEAQGVAAAQGKLQPLINGTAPAMDYLGRVMSDTSITPEQAQRIADTRRQTANMLASRLGGRSATAIATQSAQNLENGIYSANRSRADQAAGSLFGTNANATTNSANLDVGLANQIASGARNVGNNIANLTSGTGTTTANLATNTGQALSGATQNAGSAAADLATAQGSVANKAIGAAAQPTLADIMRSFTAENRKFTY